MGAPDTLLPVFSFRPNWGDGVTERLEWLTDIPGDGSKTGAEQRISLRLSARRSFEVTVEPIGTERTFLDLFIRRFSKQEFMLPLWHDHALLASGVSVGATSLSVDTTDREFVDGGMAILMGADAFSCEAVQIDTVSSGAITLAAGTANAWPIGSSLHPLRRTWLKEQPKGTRETDNYAVLPMTFMLSGPCDYDGGSEELATFAGYPILSPAPDWSDKLDLEFARNLPEVDGKVGLRSVGDPAGRSFAIQLHRWMLNGRAEQAAFRRLISRLRGKQGSIWLPSFTSDLTIAAAASPGDTHIDVRECGLNYADFPDVGRDHAITAAGEMLSLSGLATSPGAGVERINLGSPLAGALAVGDVLSFADVGRLDTDTIEIHHQTDSDGVAQVEAPFRSFPDIRDGSALGALPLPTAEMSDTACGSATDPEDPPPDDTWRVDIPFSFTLNMPSPLPNCMPAGLQPPTDWELSYHFSFHAMPQNGGTPKQFLLAGNISGDGTYNDFTTSQTWTFDDGPATVTVVASLGAGSITFSFTSDRPDMQITTPIGNSAGDMTVNMGSGLCMSGFNFTSALSDQGTAVGAGGTPSTNSGFYSVTFAVHATAFEDGQP